MFLNLYIHNVTLVTSPSEVLGHLEVIRKELMLPPRGVHADSLPFFSISNFALGLLFKPWKLKDVYKHLFNLGYSIIRK